MLEMDGKGKKQRQDVFARPVRAGRRTYFFDVKQTRKGDLFLTITESKRVFHNKKKENDKGFHYEKHKIFLYKEDFEKFHEAFKDVVDFVWENVDESLEQGGLKSDDFKDEQNESGNSSDSDDSYDSSLSESDDEQVDTEPQNEDESANPFTDVSFDDLDENGMPAEKPGDQDNEPVDKSSGD